MVALERTGDGGRPHAESRALAVAGNEAVGGTAYVTLEPCAHVGKTPPCCEALIQAGVSTVFIAVKDPDPRVCGRGIARLRASGVSVHVGLCEEEARYINRAFLSRIERRRPLVGLKVASSQDGRIALASGESKWITGEAARAFGHRLRAEFQAILVGIGTVLADDPSLDCRLTGLSNRSPVPVVLDRRGQLPLKSKLVRSSCDRKLVVYSGTETSADWAAGIEAAGAILVSSSDHNESFDLNKVMVDLIDQGVNSLLVEGGGKTHAAFLSSGLVDEVYWFSASKIIGAEGKVAIADLGHQNMSDVHQFQRVFEQRLGEDSLFILQRKKV